MSDYIKLSEAPTMTIHMPTCGACHVDVEADPDGLTCPVCGTMWSHRDGEDDSGTLYEEWSGEDLDGLALDNDAAFKAGAAYEKAEWDAMMSRINTRRINPDVTP